MDPAYQFPQRHPVHIDSAYIAGDLLWLRINYSGGCKTHFFELRTDGRFDQSSPPRVKLFLEDTTRNDNCRQFREELVLFNISKLKINTGKKIMLKLDDGHTLLYSY